MGKRQNIRVNRNQLRNRTVLSGDWSMEKDICRVMFDEAMKPFWSSEVMYDESVLMVSKEEALPEARLLFPPRQIIMVRMADYSMEFEERVDWYCEDGTLKLTPHSRIPYMLESELYPLEAKDGWSQPKIGGGHVLFHEEHFFHDRQLAVTYTHGTDNWYGPIPMYAGQHMPETLDKLKNKEPLNLVLFGDSISVGANASGVKGAHPYMPNWGQLFAMNLQKTYGSKLLFKNPSVGGKDSSWGVKHVKALVADERPDLVVIAFGMNDGTAKVDKYTYKSNIERMIGCVKSQNPHAEFILVAPTVANPETFFAGCQEKYRVVLDELTCNGVVLADMTSIHLELLKHKKFRDMTGNNINHPNDFLVRCHAQVISSLLIP